MKSSEPPGVRTDLSVHELRAITARITHPDDPLAEWRFEFEEWRKAYAELQQMEQERLIPADAPSPFLLRQHRYLLFLLMTLGEQLALILIERPGIKDAEKSALLDQVDGFLGALRDSLHAWHGESLPEHRAALSKFLS